MDIQNEKNMGRNIEKDTPINTWKTPLQENPINGWNNALENVIKNIGESSQGYKFMHFYSSRYYAILYDIFIYTSIFLSLISAILSGVNLILLSNQIISIIIMVINCIVVSTTTALNFSDFEGKSESHKLTSTKYASLEDNIRNQLGLNRTDRSPGKEYYVWLTTSYENLFQGAPLLKAFIYKKYYNICRKNNLTFPDRYDRYIVLPQGGRDNIANKIGNNSEIFIKKINGENKGEEDNKEGEDKKKNEGKVNEGNGENITADSTSDIYINIPEENSNTGTYGNTYGNIPGGNLGGNFGGISQSQRVGVTVPRRSEIYTPISELNMYSDSRMKYEMSRFMGF